MVSGAELFVALFNNLAIFIALVAVYGAMVGTILDAKVYKRQFAIGVAFGLFAIGCMNAKIPVYEGVIVDQRNAIVALSGAFGGPLSAVVSGLMAGTYRAYLGGAGVVSGVTGIGLAAISGVTLYMFLRPIDSVQKSALGALFATLLILPGFLLVGTWRTGWHLMLAMFVPYGTAIFVGIFLVSLLLSREDRRHQAEQRFRQMVAMSPEAIIVIDANQRVRLFNTTAEAYSGLKAGEVVGSTLSQLSWLETESQTSLEKALDQVRQSESVLAPIELRVRARELVLEAAITTIMSAGGARERLISLRDTTARRRVEEAKAVLEARIRQSQALESLGRLAGGVAHDFNNMLTVILGTVDLLQTRFSKQREAVEDLDNIAQAASKAGDLTAQLLAFGRKQVLEPRVLCPNSIIKGLLPLLRRSIPENIQLKVTCATDAANVLVDITRLEQVIVNLVVNARDAMPQGGQLTIESCNREIDESYAALHPDATPGEYVEVSVSDTGIGMTDEVRSRIFEPFFTTKAQGKGTGLGLATVHGIVRQSGGHVFVYSEPGRGSCFRVYLPVSMSEETALPETPVIADLPQLRGHVLLIEDSDLVRTSIRRMLKAIGLKVTEAIGGREALECLRETSTPVDLVLTDIVMRGMSGPETVAEIRKVCTEVRVLFMSGYTEDAVTSHDMLSPDIDFISKPFTLESLRRAIAMAMARPSKAPPHC